MDFIGRGNQFAVRGAVVAQPATQTAQAQVRPKAESVEQAKQLAGVRGNFQAQSQTRFAQAEGPGRRFGTTEAHHRSLPTGSEGALNEARLRYAHAQDELRGQARENFGRMKSQEAQREKAAFMQQQLIRFQETGKIQPEYAKKTFEMIKSAKDLNPDPNPGIVPIALPELGTKPLIDKAPPVKVAVPELGMPKVIPNYESPPLVATSDLVRPMA